MGPTRGENNARNSRVPTTKLVAKPIDRVPLYSSYGSNEKAGLSPVLRRFPPQRMGSGVKPGDNALKALP